MCNKNKKIIVGIFLASTVIVNTLFNIGYRLEINKITKAKEELQLKYDALGKENKSLKKDIKDRDSEIQEHRSIISNQNKLLLDKDNKINELNKKVKELSNSSISLSTANTRARIGVRFNTEELDLFYRVVEAEAGNEPYNGQLAVANVILNRIKSDKYPNTLKDVVYQKHQFEVVAKDMLYDRPISNSVKKAVQDAIGGKNNIGDCISFWATYLRKSHPQWDYRVKYTIGTHVFSDLEKR